MKHLLNKFAGWLWLKTHEVTATEIAILREADDPPKCEHCGRSPIHYLDKKCCK